MLDWLLTFAGLSGGRWAAFWGGIGSCLSEFAILGLLWRRINCHAKGCLRIGIHHVDGTPYTTCRKHHPDHPGSGAFTAEQIADAHAVAQGNAASSA